MARHYKDKKSRFSARTRLSTLVFCAFSALFLFSPSNGLQTTFTLKSKKFVNPAYSDSSSERSAQHGFLVTLGIKKSETELSEHCSGTIIDVQKNHEFQTAIIATSLLCVDSRKPSTLAARFYVDRTNTVYDVEQVHEFSFRNRRNIERLKLYDVVLLKIRTRSSLNITPVGVLADVADLYVNDVNDVNESLIYSFNSLPEDKALAKRDANLKPEKRSHTFVRYHDKALMPSVVTLKNINTAKRESCFGDLGGGAFIEVLDTDGATKTMLLGVNQRPNGNFNRVRDKIDAAKSDMSDENSCFSDESHFSFVGNYLNWINSLDIHPKTEGVVSEWPSKKFHAPERLSDWCSSNTMSEPYVSAAAAVFNHVENFDFNMFNCDDFTTRLKAVTEIECGSEFDSETFTKFVELMPRVKTVYANSCGLRSAAWLSKEGLEFAYLSDNFVESLPTLASSLVLVDASSNLINKVPSRSANLETLLLGDNFVRSKISECDVCQVHDLDDLETECANNKLADGCLIRNSILAKQYPGKTLRDNQFYQKLDELILAHSSHCAERPANVFQACWSKEFADNIKSRLDESRRRGFRGF